MTAFTIQASKNGQTITTVRIRPTVCVEKAKTLLQEGWQVHITNAAGHQYGPDEFDQFLLCDTEFLSRPQCDTKVELVVPTTMPEMAI